MYFLCQIDMADTLRENLCISNIICILDLFIIDLFIYFSVGCFRCFGVSCAIGLTSDSEFIIISY